MMSDFHHLLRTLVNCAKVLNKWGKSYNIKLLHSSGGMDALTLFFFIIIGFISSNKWTNQFGDIRTISTFFCLSVSFVFKTNPRDTRRCFNVDATSCDVVRRRIDIETTSRVYVEALISTASSSINK